MGRRGPPPKPTALRILEGNPGKRALNKREPMPRRDRPACPKWLSAAAKAEWRRIVPELDTLGLLTTVDRAALACYCQAFAELEWATTTLDRDGRIVRTPILSNTGEMVGERLGAHPAVKLQRDAFARVKAFLAEFGLTPASRSKLSTPEVAEDDPMEKLLSGEAR